MKFNPLYFVLFILLVSCKDHSEKREIEHLKTIERQNSIFNNIKHAWKFSNNPFNIATQPIIDDWNEWKNFQSELIHKPQSTISAFQQRIIIISSLSDALNKNIPVIFDTPQIRSRITAMVTKIKSLESYIILDNIPDERVVILLSDINTSIKSLQEQMQIITAKKNINLEEGETEILKSLNSSKTNNNNK